MLLGKPMIAGGHEGREPLISLVVLAYNQEELIEQAFCAALEQIYPNLEIVVSDDASSDGTWAQIVGVADSYSGPHQIRLNRNEVNLGIGGHVRKVASLAQGEIIVLAGGDDVSKPDRVELLAEAFLSHPNAMAVFSDCDEVCEDGGGVSRKKSWRGQGPVGLETLIAGGGGVGPGATYAYRRQCFFWPDEFPQTLTSEDRLLPLRAGLLGEVWYISSPLVLYRRTSQSVGRSLSKSRNLAKFRLDHLEVLRSHLEQAHRDGLLDNNMHELLKHQVQQMVRRARQFHRYDQLRRVPGVGNFFARAYFWFFLHSKRAAQSG